jgi:desulfoferrodoxin (superoxide reductase-like protein)
LAEFLAIFAELPAPVKALGRPKKRFVPSFELVEGNAGSAAPRQALASNVPPRAPSAAEEVAADGAAAPALEPALPATEGWQAAAVALETKGPIYTAASPGEFSAAKHVPLVAVAADGTCQVSVPHGMAADHFIQYLWAKDSASGVVVAGVQLMPENNPELTFAVPAGVGSITAFEACNLHGVWASEPTALMSTVA